VYAGIIVVAVLGYALNAIFLLVEVRMMRWHHGLTARGTV
jgi:ABC-type nitrate/sulfonate/bicarbonate transport system permease component